MSTHSSKDSVDSSDTDNSLDRYDVSPEQEVYKIKRRRSLGRTPRLLPKSECKKRFIPPAPYNPESKYPVAILDINLHAAIVSDVGNPSTDFEVTFDEIPIREYLHETNFYYRSNTLSGCYNMAPNFYDTERLEEWYTFYVQTYKRYLPYDVDYFDDVFSRINRDETNKKLKNNYKKRIVLIREFLSRMLESEDKKPGDKEYMKTKKEKSRVLTHMLKQIKEHEGAQTYIHPTHILNKNYSATSNLQNTYDINNPESSLILTYVYETEEGRVDILHFDLLQLHFNTQLYRYQNNCIYSLLDFLEFIMVEPTNTKIKPLIEFVEHLFKGNTEENMAKKQEHTQFDTKELLSFLNTFHFKKLYVYDNSCSGYSFSDDVTMIKHIDEKIHTLPKNIARGTRKRKRQTKSSNKRSKHRHKQRKRLG
jgi:hypothetical protein